MIIFRLIEKARNKQINKYKQTLKTANNKPSDRIIFKDLLLTIPNSPLKALYSPTYPQLIFVDNSVNE